MRAYLDSCMCMYFIERPADFGELVRGKLRAQRPRICWTALTRLECRVKPLTTQDDVLLEAYETFFARPDSLFLNIQNTTFELATELRARHRLKTADALHLAAAIEAGCEEFWTNDTRLDTAASGYLKTVTL
ncbi:hypothetical protein AGMMS49545_00060 [Betaproteobacteria bacterium]|nr:hypothetical protein AGMMS49545_00060 [Betaproteobacteria bacterium]